MPFCPNCGKEYTEGSPFCSNCGKPLQTTNAFGSSQAPTQSFTTYPERPLGVSILGGLQVVGSVMIIILGLAVTFLAPLGGILLVAGVLSLAFGLALLSGRNWARILMMIGAALDILTIVGAIWGIVLLWYLTRENVVAYFHAPK